MDYSMLMQAISTVGFPIVMCVLMFVYIQKINESHREEIDGLKDEIFALRETISSGIGVMTQILNKLE